MTTAALLDTVTVADAVTLLRMCDDNSVNTIVTSPPYYSLRDYGVDGQIGLETTMQEYITRLVTVFREARRVLREDGTFWINIGDSYSSGGRGTSDAHRQKIGAATASAQALGRKDTPGFGEKQRLMIPARLAIALQDDGWILRDEIVWHKCLSGGTMLYTRTQKGDMPMMVRDAARLKNTTVQLWNGQKWTNVISWERLPRKGTEIEIVLRSGERLSCTPEHRFPTKRGLIQADDLQVGDILASCRLPEPDQVYSPPIVTDDAAWFLGMYLAEGSRSDDCIQISGHTRETYRINRLREIAEYYGGSLTYTIDGNNLNIRMYGRFLITLLEQYISGRTAKDKGLKVRCWSHSNDWLRSLLDGYLKGDGHWDTVNNRWRLGFTRNYNLERDLRTLCARLGLRLKLSLSWSAIDGRQYPTFRGEIRLSTSGHHNEKSMTEIVEIRKARCREVYDLTVEDEPHLFSLASGVLSHNSNPMPESVRDRTTKAHEMVYLLTKSPDYAYDADAIAERANYDGRKDTRHKGSPKHADGTGNPEGVHAQSMATNGVERWREIDGVKIRNARSVWTIPTEPNSVAHFATMPTKLVRRCIMAGCPPRGIVLDMFSGSGTTALVARSLNRHYIAGDLNPEYVALAQRRLDAPYTLSMFD